MPPSTYCMVALGSAQRSCRDAGEHSTYASAEARRTGGGRPRARVHASSRSNRATTLNGVYVTVQTAGHPGYGP
jgi:hypothetical protein